MDRVVHKIIEPIRTKVSKMCQLACTWHCRWLKTHSIKGKHNPHVRLIAHIGAVIAMNNGNSAKPTSGLSNLGIYKRQLSMDILTLVVGIPSFR